VIVPVRGDLRIDGSTDDLLGMLVLMGLSPNRRSEETEGEK
jgi:hypothetical protein